MRKMRKEKCFDRSDNAEEETTTSVKTRESRALRTKLCLFHLEKRKN